MSSQDLTPRTAGATRAPCRRGEYIVIDIDGPVATNTIIMQNVTSALGALRGRLDLMRTRDAAARAAHKWLVTNGVRSFIYEVHRSGKIEQLAGMDPAEEAELRSH
jgi:hypothetical protein